MPLEDATYIAGLVPANPAPSDLKSQGDDHIRLLKKTIMDSLPGFTGAVMVGGAAAGVANAYTLTPATPLASYTSNTMVVWLPNVANTGVSTVNISGLGERTIVQSDGAALRPGDLAPGIYVVMIDTGTEYRVAGVTKNYVDQLVFTTVLPGQPGGLAPYELISENSVASWRLRAQLLRSARTANAQLTATDQARLIDYTAGTFTQTFALPAALGNGWTVTLRNSGTGDIELEAPAAVSTTSGTLATFATTNAYSVLAGLSIVPGDLLILRRTSQPYTQRIVGTVASYAVNAAQAIGTLTSSGTLATMTTLAPHGRTTGDTITQAGATPAAYNGTFVVTVTGANTLTYTMATAPGVPASVVGSYTAGSTLTLSAGYRIDDSGVTPQTISTINAGGNIATVTTAAAHGLVTGYYVTVTGATPAAYNGQFQITVLSPTSFSYTTATAPGGSATVVGAYTIQFTDWTITTRPATAGIDGRAAYVMYPGEVRIMQCDGTALNTFVVSGFTKTWTASTSAIPKPPGYRRFSGYLWGAGASGSKSGSTAAVAYGPGAGACLPFEVPESRIPTAGALVVAAGGIGPSAASTGAQGGNSTYAGMTAYGGGPASANCGGSGAGVLSPGAAAIGAASFVVGGLPKAITSGNSAGDFGGADGSNTIPYTSAYGGGGGSQVSGGGSVYGGGGGGAAGGGGVSGVGSTGGPSTFGGRGGNGGDAGVSGENGVAPAGGGGSTQTGAKAGDGGRGQLTMSGEL